MDYITDATRRRTLATQYRTTALRSADHEMRIRYATIAKAFDALADREDQLGRAAASVLKPSDAAQAD
jgi:hypothetical protein